MSDYMVVKSREIYKGKVISLVKESVLMPNGKVADREIIEHNGAAAMIPVDSDGKIIFVRQYRQSAMAEVLEIPAGTIEKGEEPLDCAVREIEEETSFKAGKITFLTKFYSAIGFCREIIYLYICEDLIQGSFNLDPDEFIKVEKYSLDEAVSMVLNGEICDSKTIIAVLAYKQWLENKRVAEM